jgi:hypothetical protein
MVSEDEYFNQMSKKNLDKLTRPSMEYTKGEEGQNDTMKIRTTLFIKFEDYTNKTVHDFTIMPVEME